jgi:hypothetical protein
MIPDRYPAQLRPIRFGNNFHAFVCATDAIFPQASM